MSPALSLRLLAWSFALALLALPVVGVLNGSFASDRWPLRQLDLHAELDRIDIEQIRSVVARHSGTGFFALRLNDLHAELAGLPWVASVEVRKRWPDTIAVRLLEHQPYAIWSDRALVSRSGQLFIVPEIESLAGLPRLSGPDERIADVVQFHVDAAQVLKSAHLVVTETRLRSRGSWHLVLADGAEIVLGRDRAQERLHRFASTIAPLLRSHAETSLRRADLRYPNGYALTWDAAGSRSDATAGVGSTPTRTAQEPRT